MLHKTTVHMRVNWDGLGITASVICAIHCAILPLVFTSLPMLGVDVINNQWFEYGMIALAFLVGVYALYHGYKRHHQSKLPVVLLSIGFLFLVVKEIPKNHQPWLVVPALVFIVSAHFINFRLCQKPK